MAQDIQGTADPEVLEGGAGDDNLYGLDGDDHLSGGGGTNLLDGGNGNDVLLGDAGSSNTLQGGAGDDRLAVDPRALETIFEGGTGDDELQGGRRGDTYRFQLGDGADTVIDFQDDGAPFATDRLVFGAGIAPADITARRQGEDLLLQHANGSDRLTLKNWFLGPAHQIERIEFADATVWTAVQATGFAREVVGTAQADTLSGTSGDDILRGLGGDDHLTGGSGHNLLDGGDGNDHLASAFGASDTLLGGAGNDVLRVFHFTESNVFEGGTGDDTLIGGHGADTYRFQLGDGRDTLIDQQLFAGTAADKLVFGSGIAAADIAATRSGLDLVFKHANGADQVTVAGWFASVAGKNFIERVEFADGTVWEAMALTLSALEVHGTEGNDEIKGTGFNDTLYGLGGSDLLDGELGTNQLDGGAGNDSLRVDYWSSNNEFRGGAGDDTLVGSNYADTYYFELGDGQDTILDSQEFGAEALTDRLVLGEGIVLSDLELELLGNDLALGHINGADRIVVKDWKIATSKQLERIEFSDGVVLLSQQLKLGTEGNDSLAGTASVDFIYGGGGNDTLFVVGNGDWLHGGEGAGYLFAGPGTFATLLGGDGNDTLYGDQESYNTMLGGAGNDLMTVDFWVYHTEFEGGTGNDTIVGGYNGDTYRFNLGDGQDTVTDNSSQGTDILQFGSGIAAADLTVVREGNDLAFKLANGTDKVTVKSWFEGTSGSYFIEQIKFVDGTTWQAAAITAAALQVLGTPQADVMTGTQVDDVLRGLGGNDTISGGRGNNTLDGGEGDDRLFGDQESKNTMLGGAGNDTLSVDYWAYESVFEGGAGNDSITGGHNADIYRFNLGDGQDVITDNQSYASSPYYTDVLQFGAGIDATQVWFRKVGNHLEVSLIGTNDATTIKDWYSGDSQRIESFVTPDGDRLRAQDVALLVDAMDEFDPPELGQITLPSAYEAPLLDLISTYWGV